MLEVIDDFLWTLRRSGFEVSTVQAIDVARVAREVGFTERATLRAAIACVVADSPERRERYGALFDAFFSAEGHPPPLGNRLLAQGFTADELAILRQQLREFFSPRGGGRLAALLAGGSELDHLFADDAVRRLLADVTSPLKKGFYTHRLIEELGLDRARTSLSVLAEGLADVLGEERGAALVAALRRELDRSERVARELLEARLERAEPDDEGPMSLPFASLSDEELDEVRRGVRLLAERLRGAARVKQRHLRRGRIDAARTMRESLATGGAPFRIVRRDRRRELPRLVILCDVSDSVRRASRFMLELVYALKELFERTRSFVFVSEIGEVTRLFEELEVGAAIARAATAVNGRENSSYGKVFRTFEKYFLGAVDRRTTVVILGDGRNNYQPSGADVLGRIRARAKSVLWLCPEPRASFGIGDSAMPAYAEQVTDVLEVASGRDLVRAARELVARG